MTLEQKFLEEAKPYIGLGKSEFFERYLTEKNCECKPLKDYVMGESAVSDLAYTFSVAFERECWSEVRKAVREMKEENYKKFILSLDYSLCNLLSYLIRHKTLDNDFILGWLLDHTDIEENVEWDELIEKNFSDEYDEMYYTIYCFLVHEKFKEISERYFKKINEMNIVA